MMDSILYKVSFTQTGKAKEIWNDLTQEEKDQFTKEQSSLPEYVIAETLAQALAKVEMFDFKHHTPYEFRVENVGRII